MRVKMKPWLSSSRRTKDMAQPDKLEFAHRRNSNGTIDSICRRCFVTVANAIEPSDLEQSEHQHICDPWVVAKYQQDVQPEA